MYVTMRMTSYLERGLRSHNENDVILRTETASAVGARRLNENDVTMIIAGLWRYGDWRHVATGCTALRRAPTYIQMQQLLALLGVRLGDGVQHDAQLGRARAHRRRPTALDDLVPRQDQRETTARPSVQQHPQDR